ncbi:STAS domain-containing protein [Streptomyces sp. NPDC088745]|uniref:STAS domain-containing protein n=1 Tax=Streptomyces sp. NPDC088745 TaxID=3365884 RepID=UPI0038195318
MTPPYPFDPPLRLEAVTGIDAGLLKLALKGHLGHGSADDFLDQTCGHLQDRPRTTVLRLDCAGLTGMDSVGLSALLMLHRRTTAARITLHLDARPPAVDRILEITGCLAHLDPEAAGAGGGRRSREKAYRQPWEEVISASLPTGPPPRPAEPETTA